ncbi:MAG: glycosyltransferase family 39 protein [Phycisphaerales bacterium]|nr:MAG: glycosyltransferase family 39 protein [Phycisphaerales bacterium]
MIPGQAMGNSSRVSATIGNRRPVDDLTDKPRTSPRGTVILVVLLTIVGAGFRFGGLDTRDFWFDESCTFIYVHNLFDWPEDSSLLVESTNLPYYAVLRGWVTLFGDSEAGYRSFSAALATLAIPLLAIVAWRLGTSLAAAVCAGLVAFNPLHIHYAHEARAYAMWVFLLSIVLWLLVEASRQTRRRWWVGYGLAMLLCLHLHYFTIYLVPATASCILLATNRRRALRRWFVTNIVVGILFIPYFLTAVLPAGRGGGSAWISGSWEPLLAIPRTLWAFLPAGGYPAHLRGLSMLSSDTIRMGPNWIAAAARIIPAMIVVLALLLVIRRRVLGADQAEKPTHNTSHLAALAGFVLVPLLLAWAYSLIVRPNYLVGRYDLVAWPALMVSLALIVGEFARTVARRRSGRAALVTCVVLGACSLVPITRMAALKPPPTLHKLRAMRLAEIAHPGDLVVTFSYDRDYLLYYLHRAGFAGRIVSYPSWLDGQIGWLDTAADLETDTDVSLSDAAGRVGEIDSTLRAGNRVWFLLDSHELRGRSVRSEINDVLLDALAGAGFYSDLFDGDLWIFSVLRSDSTMM